MWHADTAYGPGELVDVQHQSQRIQIEHLGQKTEGEKKAQTHIGMKQRHLKIPCQPFKRKSSG